MVKPKVCGDRYEMFNKNKKDQNAEEDDVDICTEMSGAKQIPEYQISGLHVSKSPNEDKDDNLKFTISLDLSYLTHRADISGQKLDT